MAETPTYMQFLNHDSLKARVRTFSIIKHAKKANYFEIAYLSQSVQANNKTANKQDTKSRYRRATSLLLQGYDGSEK